MTQQHYGPGDPRGVYQQYTNPDQKPAPYSIGGRTPVDTSQPGWAEPAAQMPTQPDTLVGQAFSGLQQVHQEHQRHVDEVHRNADRLTDQGRQEAIASFGNSEAAQLVDRIAEAVDQGVALAQSDYQQQLKGLTQPGDAAQEARNSRTWDRNFRQLEAAKEGGSAINVARQALENADPAELGVLMQELPSYLGSRGLPVDWLAPLVTQRNPALGQAQHREHQWQQAATVLRHDVQAIRTGIAKGSPPVFLVDPSRFDPDLPKE